VRSHLGLIPRLLGVNVSWLKIGVGISGEILRAREVNRTPLGNCSVERSRSVVRLKLMRPKRSQLTGFTLAELMAVIAIVGILAAVGVTYFRKHASASKVTEAQAMVQSIRAAEERYKAENKQYLDVTGTLPSHSNPDGYYPQAPDGKRRTFFLAQSDTTRLNRLWWLLGPTTSGPVQFGYAVVAGASGVQMPTVDIPNQGAMPTPTDSWYVIQAAADNNGDGVQCVVAGTSLDGEVTVWNEGE